MSIITSPSTILDGHWRRTFKLNIMGFHLTEEEIKRVKDMIDMDYLLDQTYKHGNNFDLGGKVRTHIHKCIKEVMETETLKKGDTFAY